MLNLLRPPRFQSAETKRHLASRKNLSAKPIDFKHLVWLGQNQRRTINGFPEEIRVGHILELSSSEALDNGLRVNHGHDQKPLLLSKRGKPLLV